MEKDQKFEPNLLKVELYLRIEVWGVPFFADCLPVAHFKLNVRAVSLFMNVHKFSCETTDFAPGQFSVEELLFN